MAYFNMAYFNILIAYYKKWRWEYIMRFAVNFPKSNKKKPLNCIKQIDMGKDVQPAHFAMSSGHFFSSVLESLSLFRNRNT